MSPPIEVSHAAVRALLDRWFPEAHPPFGRLGSGASTPVYRVVLADALAYLRLAEEPGECREAEARVHELLRKRGLPVPAVLRFEAHPPELDRSAALTSAIPGHPVDARTPANALAAIGRLAGRDLAGTNAVPVEGYGWVERVAGPDRYLVAEHRTRSAWAVEYLGAAGTVLASGALDGAWYTALDEAVHAWAALPEGGPSRLAHGDFDASHIYVDPGAGAYTGVIDFGEIRGTDPLYDLGHLLAHAHDAFGMNLFDAVLAGYRERAALPPDWRGGIRLQAIAIATRALAIQLGRPPNAYRDALVARLPALLGEP